MDLVKRTKEYLTKIRKSDLNAFLNLNEDYSLKTAADLKNNESNDLPLHGMIIAIKDNITTKDFITTCGSKFLENHHPAYDATVIKCLKEAAAVLIGKTNIDEFAMGSSSENSAFGQVLNPNNKEYTPGGSSSGSAAAVRAGLCDAALGSDTGGSIRQPASHCGIVGMKPTYGRVSRYGLVAFASSLDQIGTLARNVEDTAKLLNVICGFDPNDSTSINTTVPDFTEDLEKDIQGLRIGIPKEYFAEGINGEVKDAVLKAADFLNKNGAKVNNISLPHTEYAVPTYYIIAPAEASANLARYDGIRYGYSSDFEKDLTDFYKETRISGFGPEVIRRIIIGTYVLSSGYYDAYYKKATQVRTLIKRDFVEAFEEVDLILTPTSPTTAFKLGEKKDDPIEMYLSDIYTVPCNLAGLPGISIPCGKDNKSLPIGLQLIGNHLEEAKILQVANFIEKNGNQYE